MAINLPNQLMPNVSASREKSLQNGCGIPSLRNGTSNSQIRESADEALIERIANRDQAAMRELYVRHSVRIYRFVLRIVADSGFAEDIISAVFFEAWLRAEEFQGQSEVLTWLLAIARNKAFSALRRRPHVHLDDAAAIAIVDPTDTPEIAMQKRDRGALLRQCLMQLSPIHREIIDLIYYHGKSVAEASNIVGAPQSTVKTRMFYARKRLAVLIRQVEMPTE